MLTTYITMVSKPETNISTIPLTKLQAFIQVAQVFPYLSRLRSHIAFNCHFSLVPLSSDST